MFHNATKMNQCNIIFSINKLLKFGLPQKIYVTFENKT